MSLKNHDDRKALPRSGPHSWPALLSGVCAVLILWVSVTHILWIYGVIDKSNLENPLICLTVLVFLWTIERKSARDLKETEG